MKALVTGGGGFLGRHITQALVACGDDVRIFSRRYYPQMEELGVESLQGDVRDPAAVDEACRGADVVFHAAAIPGIWGKWSLYHAVNTQGTLNVIAACRKQRVKKLIYTSSPSVIYDGREHHGADESLPYPKKFLCHYAHTKALAEQAVLEANGQNGLCTVSLRPHLIWGPRDNHLLPRLIERARRGRLVRVGDGRNLVSVSYVENTAAAHLRAADALGPNSPLASQAYFLNEPEPVALWPWIDALLDLAGLPPVKRSVSARTAHAVGLMCEAVYGLLRISAEPPMTRFLAAQLSTSHYYDVAKAQRDFGYTPHVSIKQGMQAITSELQQLAAGRTVGKDSLLS